MIYRRCSSALPRLAALALFVCGMAQAQQAPHSDAAHTQRKPGILRGLLVVSLPRAVPKAETLGQDRATCRGAAAAAAVHEEQTWSSSDVAGLRKGLIELGRTAPASERVKTAVPAALLPPDELRQRLTGFIGRPIDSALTQAVVQEAVKLVNEQGRFLADIYFPEQVSGDGILVMAVQPALLGRVIAMGQKFHDGDEFTCRIRLRAGQPVDLKTIADDLAQLNGQSGWHYTAAPEFRPGDTPGTTDLVLNTTDERPLRYFFGADNTGSRTLGQGVYRTGINVGSFLGRFDHEFGYTLTTASRYSTYHQHSLTYQVPLEQRVRFAARLDLSASDALLEDGAFRARGSNQIANAEWIVPHSTVPGWLDWSRNMANESSFGVDYKRIGNTLAFNQEQISNVRPSVLQAYAGWRASWQDDWGASQLYARLTLSPGDLVHGNDNATFNASRQGARSSYWRVNANYNRNVALPDGWALATTLNAQWTRRPLVASERITLSGWGGVRGYYSDTLTSDAGVTGTLELQSPRRSFTVGDQTGFWYAFAFLDAGRSWNATREFNRDLNTTGRQFNLVSHGVGLRVETSKRSHLRVDVARRHFGMSADRQWLWHGSLQVAF